VDHTEAIVELKNLVSEDFIKKMIPFINKKAKENLHINKSLNANAGNKIRNVKGCHLELDTPTNIFYWNYIKKEIEKLYYFYKVKFPKMESHKINQIDLLKYSPGGKYNTHVDNYTTTLRSLSVIINLNNEYTGGDLVFTDQKEKETKRLELSKGSIVFFPSNFMYPHMIEPIKKGKRYSIVAWLQ
tara:strand:- start:773 stop:1330 length:558 start_codon:yes stop_codon:yes gene_type:complete